jgi:hypothetical protein
VTTESPERPSRLEQEVREILERTDAQRSPRDHLSDSMHRTRAEAQQRLKRPAPAPALSRFLTPEILRIVGALALAVVAILLGEVSRLLAVVAAIASLVVFFSLWFPTSRASSSTRPRWRGRDLN